MAGFGVRWVGVENPAEDRFGLVEAPRAGEFQATMMIGHGGARVSGSEPARRASTTRRRTPAMESTTAAVKT